MELTQDNAALPITGTLNGTPREKLFKGLGLKPLKKREWYRTLYYFFKKRKGQYLNFVINNSQR